MSVVMVLLVVVPLLAMLVCAIAPHGVCAAVTALTGTVAFVLAAALVPASSDHTLTAVRYLRADALSVVFLLATCFLYAVVGIYSIGYLRDEARAVRLAAVEEQALFARHSTRFLLGLNAFAWALICAPLVNDLALLWIAVEITTVVSALLVALDNTQEANEAAWKYVLIASSGLGIALLATIFMYYSGERVLGDSYDLAFEPLIAVGGQLPATSVRLAFVLAVVGFGTKVGLFPVHTWLPDAHAEAPTPVSALLSGSLLAVSFYAILRYYQIALAALGPRFPQTVLLVFGVLSLLLAALYLLEQRDIKRLLAYSSIEHMGIIAIGVSFGAPIALTGVLLHVLAHAAAKGNAFMGAGVLVRKFGTKELDRMAQGIRLLPWSGPMFLVAVFALSAMPPFGLFRSEFQIVSGGFAQARNAATVILVILVNVAFMGLAWATTRILFQPQPTLPTGDHPPLGRGEPSRWMVAPVVLGVLVLVVLLAPPAELVDLLNTGAAELMAGVP
jgi:hydrogenase-4 component F